MPSGCGIRRMSSSSPAAAARLKIWRRSILNRWRDALPPRPPRSWPPSATRRMSPSPISSPTDGRPHLPLPLNWLPRTAANYCDSLPDWNKPSPLVSAPRCGCSGNSSTLAEVDWCIQDALSNNACCVSTSWRNAFRWPCKARCIAGRHRFCTNSSYWRARRRCAEFLLPEIASPKPTLASTRPLVRCRAVLATA